MTDLKDNPEQKKKKSPLDMLSIGHCCHDVAPEGYILGGTASYSALVGSKLGASTGVLTSFADDFQFAHVFESENIPLSVVPAKETTIFENVYKGEQRVQHILSRANTITAQDVPTNYRDSKIVLLGSIAKEIDFNIVDLFPDALIGAVVQGMMRKWDENGLVSPEVMDWDLLNKVDIVLLSDDDLRGFEQHLPEIISQVDQVVMTMGSGGAYIYTNNERLFYPAFPTEVKDATGAGDVFTTAYLLKYNENHDISEACIYAHCAASYIIQGYGIDNLPTDAQILSRVEEYLKIHK